MNTARFYKSVYVSFYRWSFKNFGQVSLPRFNSLFGVSFLMIILLTNLMLMVQLCLRSGWFNFNITTGTFILFGAVGALLLNYFILLNNKRLRTLNLAFEKMSRRHQSVWSVIVLASVVFSCGLFLFTTMAR
ncbi:hypothetical protein SNE25_01910 [Mucilaginibacter sabulilitoris]|uniref:Uncharacterized protein n=1 Tax=Mucilaginibacter sabulilitoris TaxID=1173583 RepID=A0ABZ0TM88_9SPHI|nr:hypothetical protein [Mucilaginibacter sabulilitoris]WPU94277.1 hypothetical protein SNE25_01910 [Mucilaginibacter sabulilitoris]